MNLKQKNDKILSIIEDIKQKINIMVQDLPDNPDVNRISKNCFVMQFSKTTNPQTGFSNWLPKFHDWKYQYKMIMREIGRSSNPYNKLLHIIKKEKVLENVDKKANPRYLNLHPCVVENLKKITGE